MNTVKIYSKAIGTPVDDSIVQVKLQQQTNKADRQASIQQWKQHPLTKEFFSKINNDIAELDNEARELAFNYHQTNNHDAIIQRLLRASTLRKVIEETHSNIDNNNETTTQS